MNRKQYALFGMVIWCIVGAVVGYSVKIKNIWMLIMGILIGYMLMIFARKRVTEVLEDERIYRICEKASRRTLQIFGISSAIIGISLIALNNHTEVGYTLAFSACVLELLYLVFYGYYNIKGLE